MLHDHREVPLSTTNPKALTHFEQALQRFHSYTGDPLEAIDAALAEDPGFVLGHVFRATLLLHTSEARFLPEARAGLAAAEALRNQANERERGLIQAARRYIDGDWAGACRVWDEVLVDHPRDVFALQSAHLTDFFLGDAVNLRDRVARVLPHWNDSLPSYPYVLGMYAFGLEETNLYPRAEEVGREGLELEPRDAWAVHAVAHVMEMQTRFDEGIDWLRSREQDWAPDNGFAFHNWWHLALFHLERGDEAGALRLYDECIYPSTADDTMAMQMLDASALLWRLYLRGAAVGERWATLADHWQARSSVENGHYAFNDIHAVMAYLAAGREQAVADVLRAMTTVAAGDTSNAMMCREVGLPVARGLIAFHEGRHDEAVALLRDTRLIAHRFGGSHAQRDLLNLTLLEAALHGSRPRLAEHLVNERIAWKSTSPLTWNFAARIRQRVGNGAGVQEARARVVELRG